MNAEKSEIMNNLRNWAEKNRDITCVICVGSTGNKDKIADDLSDIDVVLYSRRKSYYDSTADWLSEIGEVAYYYQESTNAPGVWIIKKVYFSNGVRMDILFWRMGRMSLAYNYLYLREKTFLIKMLPGFAGKIIESHFAYFTKYIQRGFITIVDKCNYTAKITYIQQQYRFRQEPVSEEKLQFTINRFWHHAVAAAVYIQRKELLCAKTVGDRIMKQHLLFLIEIYALLSNGRDYDVFENGRRLELWAPEFITRRLKLIYGHYDFKDAWRAIMETIDLFSLILKRIAEEHPQVKFINPEQHFRKIIKDMESLNGTVQSAAVYPKHITT